MSNIWLQDPYSVHVGVSDDLARKFEHDARAAQATIVSLDLVGVTDSATLGLRLADVFSFPARTESLDSAVDWMADLEWLGETNGYLVEVNIDDVEAVVVYDFAKILPAVLDRWRSGGNPFVVVLVGDRHRKQALRALEESNLSLAAFAELPWTRSDTGPVPVDDHSAG